MSPTTSPSLSPTQYLDILSVSGCVNNRCNPEGGFRITLDLEHVYPTDPEPTVFAKGAKCPAHCGGQEAKAECRAVEFDYVNKTVSCELPQGAAGSNLDLVVEIGTKSKEYIGLKCPSQFRGTPDCKRKRCVARLRPGCSLSLRVFVKF